VRAAAGRVVFEEQVAAAFTARLDALKLEAGAVSLRM
jgi:hypothetical protein